MVAVTTRTAGGVIAKGRVVHPRQVLQVAQAGELPGPAITLCGGGPTQLPALDGLAQNAAVQWAANCLATSAAQAGLL